MAATTPPEEPSIALATFVAARMDDLRELVDERFERLELQREHDREIQDREHKQLLTAFADVHDGVGLLRDRHDKHLDDHEKRIDTLESENDKRSGGRARFKDSVAYATAAIGTLVGLRGLHII